jgi:hypothetical protein
MASPRAPASEMESAMPAHPQGRDALGQFCFIVHFVPLIFVVTGWLAPWRGALIFYLAFVPAMFLQWRLNRSSCVLNNLESLIRTGRWRNPANREEGAWLRTIVNDKTGWNCSPAGINAVIHSAMLLFWLAALARRQHWL